MILAGIGKTSVTVHYYPRGGGGVTPYNGLYGEAGGSARKGYLN